ncbi:unnamed protein product [[Candida] boidinii]|nr:unnamed protein product [[Candida] boidinii]
MDICVSSNFERFLWYMVKRTVAGNDAKKAGEIMNNFMSVLATKGIFTVDDSTLTAATNIMRSAMITNAQTVDTIRETYKSTSNKYILDPHTAVGIATALQTIEKDGNDESIKYISLSTAHPAKFNEVVNEALDKFDDYSFETQVLPDELKKLESLPKKIKLIETADLKTIESTIIEELTKEGKN